MWVNTQIQVFLMEFPVGITLILGIFKNVHTDFEIHFVSFLRLNFFGMVAKVSKDLMPSSSGAKSPKYMLMLYLFLYLLIHI
jgi:hypothetical protein